MADGRLRSAWDRASWVVASMVAIQGGDVDPQEINPYQSRDGDYRPTVDDDGTIQDLMVFL